MKKKRVNKRGISGVVVSVLLILLTVSLVAILWVGIASFTSESGEGINLGKTLSNYKERSGSSGDGKRGSGNEEDPECLDNNDCPGTEVCNSGVCEAGPKPGVDGLVIEASRTECIAPCGVFFDVISSTGLQEDEIINANFEWNFDTTNEGTNDEEIKQGFVVAHLFEEPGEYIIEVTASGTQANFNSVQETITVLAEPSGGWDNVYCVSNLGDDTEYEPGKSCEGKTLEEISAMGPSGSASKSKILLKRGEIFDAGESFNLNNNIGPTYVGAYGNGNDPIIKKTISGNKIVTLVDSNEVSIENLHIIGLSVANGGSIYQKGFEGSNSNDITIANIEVEETTQNAFYPGLSNSDAFLVFNANVHDIEDYMIFSENNDRVAFVNSQALNIDGSGTKGQHGIRMQGGTRTYIHGNKFRAIKSQDSITIRGNNDYTVISNNDVDLSIEFKPQNVDNEEYIKYVLAEGNKRLTTATGLEASANKMFVVQATHIVIRNNIGYDTPVLVSTDDHILVGDPSNLYIYGNTFIGTETASRLLSGPPQTPYLAIENLQVQNNLMYNTDPSVSPAIFWRINDVSIDGNSLISNNYFYSPDSNKCLLPDGVTDCTDPLMSVDLNNANFGKLNSNSWAVDAGADLDNLVYDIEGNSRPQGSGYDIGAFEVA